MYIETVPNRGSPPAILLRESYRDGKTVRKRTTLFCASLARDAELGMRNRDVLRPALERRISRGVEPLEDVFAGFDALDGGEPEALCPGPIRSGAASRATVRRLTAAQRLMYVIRTRA
jgi:hypothetical protein